LALASMKKRKEMLNKVNVVNCEIFSESPRNFESHLALLVFRREPLLLSVIKFKKLGIDFVSGPRLWIWQGRAGVQSAPLETEVRGLPFISVVGDNHVCAVLLADLGKTAPQWSSDKTSQYQIWTSKIPG